MSIAPRPQMMSAFAVGGEGVVVPTLGAGAHHVGVGYKGQAGSVRVGPGETGHDTRATGERLVGLELDTRGVQNIGEGGGRLRLRAR